MHACSMLACVQFMFIVRPLFLTQQLIKCDNLKICRMETGLNEYFVCKTYFGHSYRRGRWKCLMFTHELIRFEKHKKNTIIWYDISINAAKLMSIIRLITAFYIQIVINIRIIANNKQTVCKQSKKFPRWRCFQIFYNFGQILGIDMKFSNTI